MPDVNFNSWAGPGSRRRIAAMVVMLLGLAAGWAFQEFMPKRYSASMSLLPEMDKEDEVRKLLAASAKEVMTTEDAAPVDLDIDTAHKVITVRCITAASLRPDSGCIDVLNQIADKMRALAEKKSQKLVEDMQQQQKKMVSDITDRHEKEWPLIIDNAELFEMLAEIAQGKKDAPANWHDAVSADNVALIVAKKLDDTFQKADGIANALVALKARDKSLAAWINSPANRTIEVKVKRVVHYEDTPELIRLKDKKAEVEASRMRLLQRATSAHPLAKKMANEIEELNAQINALTRLPQVVEDVQKRTNPDLPQWQRELAGVRSRIASQSALLGQLRKQAKQQIALLKQRWAHYMSEDQGNKKRALQQKLEAASSPVMMAQGQPFTIYTMTATPKPIKQINLVLSCLIGGAAGLFAAILLLIGRRKTTLEISEKKPEFPLLGRIPHLEQNAGGDS